jgi:hypothetical protein
MLEKKTKSTLGLRHSPSVSEDGLTTPSPGQITLPSLTDLKSSPRLGGTLDVPKAGAIRRPASTGNLFGASSPPSVIQMAASKPSGSGLFKFPQNSTRGSSSEVTTSSVSGATSSDTSSLFRDFGSTSTKTETGNFFSKFSAPAKSTSGSGPSSGGLFGDLWLNKALSSSSSTPSSGGFFFLNDPSNPNPPVSSNLTGVKNQDLLDRFVGFGSGTSLFSEATMKAKPFGPFSSTYEEKPISKTPTLHFNTGFDSSSKDEKSE